ncbi:hypothetical protein HNQ77_000157 [Silvibacterium bohemicum]|uniref:Alginate export domain-containing protein n=1 Tax=Silvibacterium bohemicum TaxID=1577686 RepID=A0A841JR16_9BACT|nr:alginate export family protein [Silvibacterium bohemicum]MBB6142219.1 hypothetical protein [Silvibacterium bohemicum]
MRKFLATLFVCSASLLRAQTAPVPSPNPSSSPNPHPIVFNVYDRSRSVAWDFFAAPPYTETYGYGESLLRLSVSQKLPQWDWLAELTTAAMIDLPTQSVSKVTAQGQLGLGGTYYASNGNNDYPAAAFFKQGYLRRDFDGSDKNVRIGRFEFFEGLETQPKNATIAWLQPNRVSQRLISNFGFTVAQRSFDGVDGHYGSGTWDITGMAARATQGVFNMNGNPELNVDVQYLAFTKSELNQHVLWRVFGIGYHDGRTGVVKTDNRPLAVRQADHKNIRLGTYGGDVITSIPAGPGNFDFLAWAVLQNGNWGVQSDFGGAAAVEGGYQYKGGLGNPWFRSGWFRSTGDNNPNDNEHHTFSQLLPTPRNYARFPFYNLMNSTDDFIQVIDNPIKRVAVRSDLHWLQLTSGKDLWYQGGGAFDNKVFGFTGRPANGHSSFSSLADVSADWTVTKTVSLNFYYAYAWGKSAISAIYPTDHDAQFGYAEFLFRWGTAKPVTVK